MRVLSTAAGTARHGVGALAEAAVIVAIGAALVFGAAVLTRSDPAGAADVYAAKGGNGGGHGGGAGAVAAGSSISLDQAGSALSFQSQVTFTTSAVGLNGGEYPLVYVQCTSAADGSLLYGQLDHPNATFVLGGGSSNWWSVRDDANCSAWLYAYGGQAKGYDVITELAGPESFFATGG